MPTGWRLASLLALASSLAGCSPRINSFSVLPESVCPGDAPSVARWDARGNLALQIQADDPRLRGDAQAYGGKDAQPPPGPDGSHTIMLRLTANDGQGQERAAQTHWILLFPDSFQTVIAFPTQLGDGGVIASGTKNPERWGDRFEVATVSALGGRHIEVSHADKVAVIGESPSTEFSGTKLEGLWELTWKPEGSSSPPEELRVAVVARCKRRSQ